MLGKCLICHLPIGDNDDRVRCENGHVVHHSCLETWVRAAKLLSSEEIFCPICHMEYPRAIVEDLFGIKQAFKQDGRQISFELRVVDEEEGTQVPTWARYARKINLAQEAIDQFNHEIAILHLFDILQENPNDIEATFLFGVVNFQRNNYMLAQHFFYKTLELDQDHFLANLFLAEIMLKNDRKPDALELFEKVKNLLEDKNSPEMLKDNKDWVLVTRRIEELRD